MNMPSTTMSSCVVVVILFCYSYMRRSRHRGILRCACHEKKANLCYESERPVSESACDCMRCFSASRRCWYCRSASTCARRSYISTAARRSFCISFSPTCARRMRSFSLNIDFRRSRWSRSKPAPRSWEGRHETLENVRASLGGAATHSSTSAHPAACLGTRIRACLFSLEVQSARTPPPPPPPTPSRVLCVGGPANARYPP